MNSTWLVRLTWPLLLLPASLVGGCAEDPRLAGAVANGSERYSSVAAGEGETWDAYCQWASDSKGRPRVVVFYHRPSPGRGMLPEREGQIRAGTDFDPDRYASVISLRCTDTLNGMWIDGVRHRLGKELEVWYVSDEIRARRVFLSEGERRILIDLVARRWQLGEAVESGRRIAEYIRDTIVPRLSGPSGDSM